MMEIHRVLVLTGDHGVADPTKRGGRYNEEDMATHAAMRFAFESLGEFSFEFMTDHHRLLHELRQNAPDLVVNFCDTGYRNNPAYELNVPAYLELLGIPYTGAPPAAIAICYDKQIVRLVAQALDIAVPSETFVSSDAGLVDLPGFFPALIKPNRADGSVGITKDAVVRTPTEARAYLDWLRTALSCREVLVQEYLPGPEYSIGLIGNPETALDALPALEVDFSGLPEGLDPILSFESKAIPDSPYWTDIRFRRAETSSGTEERLIRSSKLLFHRLGLRDYGRFDFRTGADGEIKLMEVNPNPAWANDGKLALMADFAGLGYAEYLRRILRAAVARLAAAERRPSD